MARVNVSTACPQRGAQCTEPNPRRNAQASQADLVKLDRRWGRFEYEVRLASLAVPLPRPPARWIEACLDYR